MHHANDSLRFVFIEMRDDEFFLLSCVVIYTCRRFVLPPHPPCGHLLPPGEKELELSLAV